MQTDDSTEQQIHWPLRRPLHENAKRSHRSDVHAHDIAVRFDAQYVTIGARTQRESQVTANTFSVEYSTECETNKTPPKPATTVPCRRAAAA